VIHIYRAVPPLVVLGFLVLSGALLYWPLQALFAHIPLSYNEGWNAFHALRLRNGGPLYPPVAPDIFINYPPLSFNIVAALASVIGDDIFAGRVVALAALLVTTVNVGLIARRLGTGIELSVIGAFAFFCFTGMYFSDYIAVNDPQWLAQAFQATGLTVLLGSDRRSWRPLALAALLMVAGGLCKHNVFAVPLTVTVWLAIEDRTALRRWLTAAGAIALAALAICYALYGPSFLEQVIGNRRTYSLAVVTDMARYFLPQISPFLLAALVAGFLRIRRPEGRFVLLYLLFSLTIGTALMLAVGVIYNTLFDLVIAMMIGAALACQLMVDRFATLERGRAAALALAAVLLATRFIMLAHHSLEDYKNLARNLGRQEVWTATIERIRAEPGPVACENLALCYWAGRSSEIEFFNFGQRARVEPGYDTAFIGQVMSGTIGLIQKDPDTNADRLPPDIEALISNTYQSIQTVPVTLLESPRSGLALAALDRP
jgi:hypothetical protein